MPTQHSRPEMQTRNVATSTSRPRTTTVDRCPDLGSMSERVRTRAVNRTTQADRSMQVGNAKRTCQRTDCRRFTAEYRRAMSLSSPPFQLAFPLVFSFISCFTCITRPFTAANTAYSPRPNHLHQQGLLSELLGELRTRNSTPALPDPVAERFLIRKEHLTGW